VALAEVDKLDAQYKKTGEMTPMFGIPILVKDAGYKGVPLLNTYLDYVPVITVPSGFTPEHFPTGVTFFGRPYADASVLHLAYSYEQATHHRVPPVTVPPIAK
jgi:Asp-tRNA(Asn)/Glu-tRNA(Gln) amidotransferase A subunit family amidase